MMHDLNSDESDSESDRPAECHGAPSAAPADPGVAAASQGGESVGGCEVEVVVEETAGAAADDGSSTEAYTEDESDATQAGDEVVQPSRPPDDEATTEEESDEVLEWGEDVRVAEEEPARVAEDQAAAAPAPAEDRGEPAGGADDPLDATTEEEAEGEAGAEETDESLRRHDGHAKLLAMVMSAPSEEFMDVISEWTDANEMVGADVLKVYRMRSQHTSPRCAACANMDECALLPPLDASKLSLLQRELCTQCGFISKYLLTDRDEGRRLLEALFGYGEFNAGGYDARLRDYVRALPKPNAQPAKPKRAPKRKPKSELWGTRKGKSRQTRRDAPAQDGDPGPSTPGAGPSGVTAEQSSAAPTQPAQLCD